MNELHIGIVIGVGEVYQFFSRIKWLIFGSICMDLAFSFHIGIKFRWKFSIYMNIFRIGSSVGLSCKSTQNTIID